MNRRSFLTAAGAAVTAAVSGAAASPLTGATGAPHVPLQPPAAAGKARFRTGLVAYSYRKPLESKAMTYEDLIRIAVETGIDGLDMTVYWMPNTSDDYILPSVFNEAVVTRVAAAVRHEAERSGQVRPSAASIFV